MRPRLRVVIHGGQHKSGTTSFQLLMAACRRSLLESGVFYPDLPNGQHGQILNTKTPDWDERALRGAVDEAHAAGAHTLLLSAEVVCTLGAEGFRRLSATLTDCDLVFLFAFRHWSGFLPSRWAQNCKRRDSQTLLTYFDRTLAWDGHVDQRFDLVLKECLATGASVIAVSFDRAVADHGSVIPALLDAIHVFWPLKGAPARWANATSDRDSVELVRLLNGAVAARLNLPQDDLFISRGEYRQIQVPFDLAGLVYSLPAGWRDQLISFGRRTEGALALPADWQPAAADLLADYAHLFVNARDGAIFPPRPARSETFWKLEWQEIVDHPLFVELIERAINAVRERTELG